MKIPKYVYELVELGRLRPAPLDEQANSSVAQQLEKLIALVSKKH